MSWLLTSAWHYGSCPKILTCRLYPDHWFQASTQVCHGLVTICSIPSSEHQCPCPNWSCLEINSPNHWTGLPTPQSSQCDILGKLDTGLKDICCLAQSTDIFGLGVLFFSDVLHVASSPESSYCSVASNTELPFASWSRDLGSVTLTIIMPRKTKDFPCKFLETLRSFLQFQSSKQSLKDLLWNDRKIAVAASSSILSLTPSTYNETQTSLLFFFFLSSRLKSCRKASAFSVDSLSVYVAQHRASERTLNELALPG